MNLVFEIGTEELPASFQKPAVEWLREHLWNQLRGAGLLEVEKKRVPGFATPRRLAVIVPDIKARKEDESAIRSGPSAKVGFQNGKWTKAAEGFARKWGVPIEKLRIADDCVVADVIVKGYTAEEEIPEILLSIIRSIPFPKSMRWDSLEGDKFARPVHWIGAALDGKPLPVKFADVESGLTTRGHRFHSPQEFPLPSAAKYVDRLREAHVLADWGERKKRVAAEVERSAREAGGVPRPDDDLLETVTGLVEEPFGVAGSFDKEFLELPPEVLLSEMRGHQKYFAVQDASGTLLPAFVAVSNTKVRDPAVSRRGYERVLRARLADGKFFFDEDRKVRLRTRIEKLGRRTFVQGLGTELERVHRLRELSLWLHGATGRGDPKTLAEAAELCKADLTTGMVGEFPELQGVMGRVYALHDGEPKEVADAIFEHYLPRGAEDRLPEKDTGALLGIADRLDLLVGMFGLDKEPTGTADPYGLRRAAVGLLRITLGRGLRFDIAQAIGQAEKLHKRPVGDRVWHFLLGRLEVHLREQAQPDSIQAALHTGVYDVVGLQKRVAALQTVREKNRAQFEATAAAFKRIANILLQAAEKKIELVGFRDAAATAPAERALADALKKSRTRVAQGLEAEEYLAAYAVLAELRPVVDRFFDEVMVMDPDPALRDNRLSLLNQLQLLFAPLADFSRLQVEKSS